MVGKNYKFELDESEYKKLEKWWNKHFKGQNFGAIGGGLTFHITPTSIGEVVEAECCGKKIALRDLF